MVDGADSGALQALLATEWRELSLALVVLAVGLCLAWVMARVCDHQLGRLFPRSTPAGRTLMGRLVRLATLALSAVLALQIVGVPVTSLLATGTVLFVGLGLAVQKILQSLVAGTLILLEREVEPGDVIRFEGEEYRVVTIGLRTTQLESRFRETLILPNYVLATSPVLNLTHREQEVELRFDVQVAYGSESGKVREALITAAQSLGGRTGRPPVALLTRLGDSGIDWRLRVEIEDPWLLPLRTSELGERVLVELAEVGVTIPFPQLDVHLEEKGGIR